MIAEKKSKAEEFEKFGTAVAAMLSVSREELKRREEKWKKERERKKRLKTASRVSPV